ncbi:MAG TPA: amino acid adenylation domain-containing protein [Pyrinomonadaceae bacterium]
MEAVLGAHPGVREAVVVAREDIPGEKRLVAYILPHDGEATTTRELRSFLKQKLPENMIPSTFVMMEAFPLSPNGKVDRRGLPVPDATRPVLEERFVEPRTEVEGALAKIWTEVLGIEQIGVYDNFFELGGDSILGIQVIARVNQAGLALTPRQLFQHQTIAELAAASLAPSNIKAEQGTITGLLPLTPIQHWFFEQNLPEPHHWNQAMLLEARTPLDISLLEHALQYVLAHHDALRLRFMPDDTGWQQFNAGLGETVSCRHVELSTLRLEEQRRAFEEAVTDSQASLNLTDGPLLRVTLFDWGAQRPNRLLIVIHHLAVDGFSWRILLEDLQTVYRQLTQGEALQLPPKTTAFKHWAERLTAYAQSADLRQEYDYWQAESGGWAARLPVDYPLEGGANTEASAAHVTTSLSSEETQALLRTVPKTAQVQINDLLLTALGCALTQWTGERSCRVDIEGHGREQLFDDVDLSRTVGWFTTITPVRLGFGEDADPGEALRLVRQHLRRIPAHGIGYGVLRYLKGSDTAASLRALPQAEVSFNYLGQLDQLFSEDSLFKLDLESVESFHSPRGARRYLLDVGGLIVNGQLRINWTYSENIHRRTTIERLAENYMETLRALIVQCLDSRMWDHAPADGGGQGDVADADTQLPMIVPAPEERHKPFPLTDVQQAYLFGRSGAFELSNAACHIYTEFDFDEPGFDLERFNQALRRLIDRHEMLRAIVLPEGQQQILERVPPYQIEVLDLREQSPSEVEVQLQAIRERMSYQVLPSDQWPLFEIRATLLGEQRLRIHFDLDLLIGDAWSWQLLIRELFLLYQNPNIRFDPFELSFRDYVLGLEAVKETALYKRSLDYWQQRLPTLPPAPELPLAKNPGSLARPLFVRRSLYLPSDTWQQLKSQATRRSLTPSGLLLAAFAEVLATWSKSPRLTLNLPLFNRLPLHPQVNEIVGDFTSLALLAVENSPDDTFEARAMRLQEQLWKDLDYRWVGGMKVLRDLVWTQEGMPRATMPVVFTSLIFHDVLSQFASLNAPQGKIAYGIAQTPQVWIDLQVTEEGGELGINWDAVEELFPEGLLDDMFDAYCGLLQRLADDEQTWLSTTLDLVPAAQRARRAALNDTGKQLPTSMLHTLFNEQAAHRPQQAAVVTRARTLTYEELQRLSKKVGHWLRQRGARPNTLVAVVMEKGWEQVVAVLGVHMSGAAYLPIDPEVPEERLRYLLENGGVEVILTQPWLDENLQWPTGFTRLPVDDQALAGIAEVEVEAAQGPDDLAYVIYTSGSTGQPKGVMISHRGAVNTILDINEQFGVNPQDRVLALSSLSFDLSVYDIFGTLAAGATIVMPEASAARDPERWLEMVKQEHVTVWNSVPALMQLLVECAAGRAAEASAPQLRSLRLVMLSGDWIPVRLPDEIRRLVEGVRVISLGGATEASIWSVLRPVEEVRAEWKSIPYGRPMANQRMYVLDERMQERADWVTGQIYIGGEGLARGYWRDEEKTRASFIEHPVTGERLYRTGDLGRHLPDGEIEFLGREDYQVKVQGYRVELGEIEAALAQHPQVREAIVMALGKREEGKQLAAYVVTNGDQAESPERGHEVAQVGERELRHFLREKLPDHMIPASFVILDNLPLTPNGKIDRKALPAPGLTRAIREMVYAPPSNSLEKMLAEIWTQVLKVEQVGRHDNFFDLGGNSLLAIQVMTRLRQAEIEGQIQRLLQRNPQQLFQYQTIAQLAEALSQSDSPLTATERLQSTSPGDAFSPLDIQPTIQTAAAPFAITEAAPHWEETSDADSGLTSALQPGRFSRDPEASELIGGMILDPQAREQFKKQQPGLRRVNNGNPFVKLSAAESDETLKKRYAARRTHRSFMTQPIAFDEFSKFMGCLRQMSVDGRPKYLYASAGGLYPVQTYLHVKAGGIEGLAAGTYYYHPVEHRLVLLAPDVDLDRSIHEPFTNQPTFDQAAFSLFLIAQLSAIAPMYGEQSIRFVTIEAGLMAQLLETSAPAAQIGLCQIGGLNFERIRHLFTLEASHELVYSLLGGRVETANDVDGEPVGRVQKDVTRAMRILDVIRNLSTEEVGRLLDAHRLLEREEGGK